MTRDEASRRYVAAARKAGKTVAEMNKAAWNLITDDGVHVALGLPPHAITMTDYVEAAEAIAGGLKA